jgi:acyl-[acyl-carrier-protein]-phospholipid O-acyltransferase/long-chain-fatty-acid--[acyl-carrier-protein] ligase
MPLLLSRRFAPLFACQFFAAFNDNFLKTALVFVILFGGSADAEAEVLITTAGAVFIAPYFFLSALGGELADRHDKARVAQWIKFVEIFVAALAVMGYARGSLPILFTALFGFGVLGALFGPLKYGILPDHLAREQLPAGNALVEGATFVAILTGTIMGGLASRGGALWPFALLVMGFGLASWIAALLIPPTGEGAPKLNVSANIVASTTAMIRHLRADSRLWWGALVTSWFWLVGIVVLSLLPPLIKSLIGGDEDTVTVYLALFSVAVGVGSGLAAMIARGRIVLRTTLAGAVLLGVFALDIGFATLGTPVAAPQGPASVFSSALGLRAAIDFAGLAIGGGLFIVPAFAAVQAWSSVDYRARNVAAVNVLNAAFMTGGTVLVALLQKAGVTVPVLFLGLGAATLIVAFAIWQTMPSTK